ncbi:MAG: S8/S53 family peptidase [Chloroflexi bacterium]|nr:S8/S53 family peptidase [Chloroflexota bacterium]
MTVRGRACITSEADIHHARRTRAITTSSKLRTLLLLSALALGFALQPSGRRAALAAPSPWGQDARLVALPGSIPPDVRWAQRLSPLAPGRPMALALTLRLRDEAGLQRFLAAVSDPRSPLFRHFLTPRQFAARFAPTPTDRWQVEAWLGERGLRVTNLSANALQIAVRGTVAAVEAAFGTPLFHYRLGSRRFVANAGAVRLPEPLASRIVTVGGMTDLGGMRSTMSRLRPRSAARYAPSLGFSPQDIASLYSIQPLWSQSVTGTGQTIALVEYADYSDKDIATYDAQFGITATTERVPVQTSGGTGAKTGDGQDECELDIEMVHAVAPGAHLLVYEAPNRESGAVELWNRIVSDDRAQVVSTSWGRAEDSWSRDTIRALNQIFEEAVAQGQAIFAASGDEGAYDGSTPAGGIARQRPLAVGLHAPPASRGSRKLMVDFPASDPWVTGVGGTRLVTNSDGSYQKEVAWSDRNSPDGAVGSGGGLSTLFLRPAYQAGPGVANRYSNGMRQVPDVAANADYENSPYAIYTVDSHGSPGWQAVGGTSASTPLWASYLAMVDQSLGQSAGFVNPTLYLLGQRAGGLPHPPFHDVTQGTNLYYPATPGWDFATGWGSFDAVSLLSGIQSIGGVVHVQPPSTDFSLEAEVDIKDHGQLVGVQQVRRGQTIYLSTYITVRRLGSDSAARRQLTLALKGHAIYRSSVSDQVSRSDVGRTLLRSVRWRLPRGAARGSYTLTIVQTIQDDTEQAKTTLQVL